MKLPWLAVWSDHLSSDTVQDSPPRQSLAVTWWRRMRDEPRIRQSSPARDYQSFSKASIAATTVMCALAGFAPVTMRPLVMEKASKGTGGAI